LVISCSESGDGYFVDRDKWPPLPPSLSGARSRSLRANHLLTAEPSLVFVQKSINGRSREPPKCICFKSCWDVSLVLFQDYWNWLDTFFMRYATDSYIVIMLRVTDKV
jgi:hypothetical protein